MASYKNPQLREMLAAEYVLGTLRGRARERFVALLRYDFELRRTVAAWEARLTPLAAAAAEISPPGHVWQAISKRIADNKSGAGWWASLGLWRALAIASTSLALVLATFVGIAPRPEPPMAMVAVMNDDKGHPALVVSWPPMAAMKEPHVRIKVVQAHPVMEAGTSWEMWMIPGGKATPVSLGLITTDRDQVMKVDASLAHRMGDAWGIAMSVEPAHGSPTGAPSGPVVFKGQCIKLL
jgi:anti-sigma-K factor RskA